MHSVTSYCTTFVIALFWIKAGCEYHESIYWSPLNKIFHFSSNDFKNNKAFHTVFVTQNSNIVILCPNIATILATSKQQLYEANLYENIWIVGEKAFYSCDINSSNMQQTHKAHICNQPTKLNFYVINFDNYQHNQSVYLVATSNGRKDSLNSTSGGHCMDKHGGVSMRIKFTYCHRNHTDDCQNSVNTNKKQEKTPLFTNNTTTTLNQEATKCSSTTAILVGILLALSIIANLAGLYYVCVWSKKTKKTANPKSDEPTKSLIVDPHKSKHGRVSAAL